MGNCMIGSRAYLLASLIFLGIWRPAPLGSAQTMGRQSLGIGALAQTTSNKVTEPCHFLSQPGSGLELCTKERQLFAGPSVDYTWGVARSLSLEGRAAYLPGKQPVVDWSGGGALLMTGGVRATLGSRRVRFYARLAPGFVSFSQAITGASPTRWQEARVTHFALDEGGGAEVRVEGANTLQFDVGRILYIERGRTLGESGAISSALGSLVENHGIFTIGVAHYFGAPLESPTAPYAVRRFRTEADLSYAIQTQSHLAFPTPLSTDTGIAVSGAYAFLRWIGIDGAIIVLPGGDIPDFQDGGTETELLAGLRIGVERRRYGIFAKYRVGTATFASTINDETTPTPPLVRSWSPAADAGAIFEFYPRREHLLLRLDVGEQYTYYHSVTVKEPAPQQSAVQESSSAYSPLILIGSGWRF